MTTDLQTLIEQRKAHIEQLRALYGFSEPEARDFADQFGVVDSPVDSVHVEQAA